MFQDPDYHLFILRGPLKIVGAKKLHHMKARENHGIDQFFLFFARCAILSALPSHVHKPAIVELKKGSSASRLRL